VEDSEFDENRDIFTDLEMRDFNDEDEEGIEEDVNDKN
jgi:hypothetical protein